MTNNDVIRKIRIDHDLESYKGFFDHDWATRLVQLLSGSKLEEISSIFCTSLKGISNARRMPWLLVDSLKNAIEGVLYSHTPFPIEVIREFVRRISTSSESNKITLPQGVWEDGWC